MLCDVQLKQAGKGIEEARCQPRNPLSPDNGARQPSKRRAIDKDKCLFCELGETEEFWELHKYSTMGADTNLKQMTTQLQDAMLLAKITGGDLIELERKL